MRRILSLLFVLLSCSLTPVQSVDEPRIFLSQILTDPVGADTGREVITLWNGSAQRVDISGWQIDPDTLPVWSFPMGTFIEPGAVLEVHLRADGVGTPENVYTGASFGSANMGNIRGAVALYRPGGTSAPYLEDYIPWGDSSAMFLATATEAGFWYGDVSPSAEEGKSLQRTCLLQEVVCFQYSAPQEGYMPLEVSSGMVLTESGTVMTGVVLPPQESPSMEPPLPQVSLAFVSMMNSPGIADDVGLYIRDDGNGGEGSTLRNLFLRVDNQRMDLSDVLVHTGDVLHVSMNNGAHRPHNDAMTELLWTEQKGLVATTEQVFLENEDGVVQDAICWSKDPIPVAEVSDMQALASLWSGPCFSSSAFMTNTLLVRELYGIGASLLSWSHMSPAQVQPENFLTAPTTSSAGLSEREEPCTETVWSNGSVRLSEFLPNPEGSDTGEEWIELHNTSNEEVSLCGVFLDDAVGGSAPYDLSGVTLAPFAYVILKDTETRISLGNTSDSLRVLNAAGEVMEEVSYTNAPSGRSYSKLDDTF
ncbi:hypothetical protein COW46_00390 [Candidatus Gracilibacteria bacterium CG17_big_fil_post_rev_8_21_14_2_50_48_13]|nr:MAG: hypothetical protein COW46_00390 [Candidatus Gracilibacteria bacterium CG17_big_fil_post_rev_8_21_14_2_50_48_13]